MSFLNFEIYETFETKTVVFSNQNDLKNFFLLNAIVIFGVVLPGLFYIGCCVYLACYAGQIM